MRLISSVVAMFFPRYKHVVDWNYQHLKSSAYVPIVITTVVLTAAALYAGIILQNDLGFAYAWDRARPFVLFSLFSSALGVGPFYQLLRINRFAKNEVRKIDASSKKLPSPSKFSGYGKCEQQAIRYWFDRYEKGLFKP